MLIQYNKKEQITPQIIPLSQHLEQKPGTFEITNKTQIVVSNNELLSRANLLKEYIKRINGLEINISTENS